MIIETVLIALIVAFIRKGKIKYIEEIKFKFWYLIIIGFLVQSIPSILLRANGNTYDELANLLDFPMVLASYVLIIFALIVNLNLSGVYFALAGTVLNAIVIISNQGMMPVSKDAILYTGYDKGVVLLQKLDFMHFVMGENTSFKALADIIPMPKWYPFPQVLSIGDILISVGLFLFVQYILVKKNQESESKSSL